MALTGNADWRTEDVKGYGTKAMLVLVGAQIYNGSLCSADTTSGRIKPYDGTDADRMVGWHFGDAVLGATTPTPNPSARICPGGFMVRDLAVGALANDDTDFNKPVYANDDGTYSITQTASSHLVGHVMAGVRLRVTDAADVLFIDVLGSIGA